MARKTKEEKQKEEILEDVLPIVDEDYDFYVEAQKRSEEYAKIDRSLTKEEKAALQADAKRRFRTGS